MFTVLLAILKLAIKNIAGHTVSCIAVGTVVGLRNARGILANLKIVYLRGGFAAGLCTPKG